MQAGDDDGAVEEAEDQAAEDTERRVRPVNAVGQVVGELAGDGADNDEGQEAGDQQGDERGQQEVRGALEDLVQVLLDEAHDPGDDQGGDDHRLVADLGDLEAEEVPHGGLVRVCPELGGGRRVRHGVGGQQRRGDHGCAHRGTQVSVTAEALRSGEADEHGQEREGRRGDEVDERVVVGHRRVHLDDGLLAEEALGRQDRVEGHKETTGDQCREDRDEDVRDHLDEAGEDVATGLRFFLGLVLGDLTHAMVRDHVGVDLVDVAGTDDDLEHAAGGECTLQIFVVIEGLLVDLGLVRDHQAETGCAVRCCADVGCAADCFDDLSCHLGVIHCRPHSFLKTPRATPLLRRAGRCVAID